MAWKKLSAVTEEQARDFAKYRKKARFLVDESLGEAVSRVLRENGWNAVFAGEAKLRGRPDEDVFAFSGKYDRILLTHDRDFLDDRHFPPHRNPGIVVLPGASGGGDSLVVALGRVLSIIGPNRKAFRSFKIEITEDGTWNVKSLVRVSDAARNWRLRFGKHGEVYGWEDQ